MSFPRGGRRFRRVIGGMLVVAATAMGLVAWRLRRTPMTTTRTAGSASARWCPLKPHPHAQEPTGPGSSPDQARRTPTAGPPGSPHKPGHADRPGPDRQAGAPPKPPPPRSAPSTSGTTTAPTATRGASRCATARASWPGGCARPTGIADFEQPHRTAAPAATPRTGTTTPRRWATSSTTCPPSAPSPRPTTAASATSPGSWPWATAPSPSRSTTSPSPAGTTSAPCRPRTSATCTSPTSRPRRASARPARRPRRADAPGGGTWSARTTPRAT